MADRFYVVEVEDHRDEGLAGHGGAAYVSPAQPPDQALALVRILLGRRAACEIELSDGPWRLAIAGGSRVIKVHAARADGQLTI
ncbi:MAG TPA: hypothetical protein VMF07_17515 [Solirubrobacteraceae bacterium]|nr:hypothetical protein [Solirubrobacteraceae bacterium]